jgi:hypothetical protein
MVLSGKTGCGGSKSRRRTTCRMMLRRHSLKLSLMLKVDKRTKWSDDVIGEIALSASHLPFSHSCFSAPAGSQFPSPLRRKRKDITTHLPVQVVPSSVVTIVVRCDRRPPTREINDVTLLCLTSPWRYFSRGAIRNNRGLKTPIARSQVAATRKLQSYNIPRLV